MKIEKIDINLLNSSEYNPRKDLQPEDIEYQKIKRSIEEFGYVDPLIVNKDMTVIGGNQRLKVLKELNYKKVDCVLLDLDKTKEKALNIALNKIEGEWDLLKLKDLLQELDTGEIDMDITGFDYTDLEELMTQFYVPEEKDDEVPDISEEPISKLGDLYKLGEHRLLCGDATKIDDVERLMDGNKVDMVFTDPPYGINVIKGNSHTIGGDGKLGKSKIYRAVKGDNTTEVAQLFYEIIANRCKLIVIWGGNYFTDFLPPSRCWFIWDKERPTQLTFCGVEMAWVSENKHPHIYKWLWDGGKRKGNKNDELDSRIHPTQKPVGLFVEILKEYSGNVLDPFGGSGSTLIACEKLKRKCYMMEIDPHYVDVIIKRYENYTNKKARLIKNGNTRA